MHVQLRLLELQLHRDLLVGGIMDENNSDRLETTEADTGLAIEELEERDALCEWHGGCLCSSCTCGCTSSTCVIICW